ncbi:MAG: glutathione-disulfide reductase [Devosiaceae bacterium]|nr:glutathione-disulfide reductase [Devosiaceae bacterium MH13]
MSETKYDYDLFVIGGGSGGVRAARIASQYGAKVALAEEYRYGGTCVIRGCVPKKLLVYASHFPEVFEEARGFGWSVGETSFDWASLIAHKDHEIDRLDDIYRTNLEKAGVELHRSRAVVEGPHTVRLLAEDRTITTERILVATGATPVIDTKIPGHEHVITSNEAFHLDALPQSVLIAGAGYIAIEFAGIFNGLGVDTTVIYRRSNILRGFDDDLRSHLRDEMVKKGVKFVFDDVITSITKRDDGKLVSATTASGDIVTDQIMFAIGRAPNTKGLGLEAAGIETDPIGAIPVSDDSQTSCPSIYAVGDVTNRANLTPVAIREGHAFADSTYGGKPWTVDHSLIPTAVFSQPELGTIGLTEEQARAKFPNMDCYMTRFRAMKHAFPGRDEYMMMKILVDADTGKVVGVHLAGEGMGEVIQAVGIAVAMGATKADFDRTIAVHPTAAEELVTMRVPAMKIREADHPDNMLDIGLTPRA